MPESIESFVSPDEKQNELEPLINIMKKGFNKKGYWWRMPVIALYIFSVMNIVAWGNTIGRLERGDSREQIEQYWGSGLISEVTGGGRYLAYKTPEIMYQFPKNCV